MSPIEQHGSDLPDNLPLLTQTAEEDALNELPTLTEIIAETQTEPLSDLQPDTVAEAPLHETATPVPHGANEADIREILQHLEAHIENVLSHKLNQNLEQLQHQAVEQAVNELKAELPALLHKALNGRPGL